MAKASKTGNELVVGLIVLVLIVGGFALFQGSSVGEAVRSLTYSRTTTIATNTVTNTLTTGPRTGAWNLYSCTCNGGDAVNDRCYESNSEAESTCAQICQSKGKTVLSVVKGKACPPIK